jgi:ADP-ribose pyrophosphatase YjhB (NUDIX family)
MTIELTAGGITYIPELGVEMSFSGESQAYGGSLLSCEGVNVGNDLFWDVVVGKGVDFPQKLGSLKVIVDQLRKFRVGQGTSDTRSDTTLEYALLHQDERLPFLVAQTSVAILKYGIAGDVHPSTFLRERRAYIPNLEDLEVCGFRDAQVKAAGDGLALIAGSVALFHSGRVLLAARQGGAYDGRLTIPGGHCEGPLDVAALREHMEETGMDRSLVTMARPLGIADQVILVRSDKKMPSLARYINLMWQIDTTGQDINDQLDVATHMGWRMYTRDEISRDVLTPSAMMALEMTKFLR